MELLGYAYAGQGMWDHWWTQHGIHLSPRGSWSAVIDEVRLEKLEVPDGPGRLLAVFDLRQGLPPEQWSVQLVLNSRRDWEPLGRLVAPGERWAGGSGRQRREFRRTIVPSELSAVLENRYAPRVRIIGDVAATALSHEQLAVLRASILRGRTLIVSGGDDLERVGSWERAGLLAASVKGRRDLPGLRILAG